MTGAKFGVAVRPGRGEATGASNKDLGSRVDVGLRVVWLMVPLGRGIPANARQRFISAHRRW